MEWREAMYGSRNPDELPDPNELNFDLSRRSKALLLLGATASTLALIASPVYDRLDKTGNVAVTCPPEQNMNNAEVNPNFGTLNVRNEFEPEKIRQLMETQKLLAIGLQEVPHNDVAKYVEAMPDKCIISIVADSKDISEGGQTNIIIANVKPEQIYSEILGRQTFWESVANILGGFAKDTQATAYGSPTLKNSLHEIPESRVIISARFALNSDDTSGKNKTEEDQVTFTTSHLTINAEEKADQFSKLRNFVMGNGSNNKVVCADWNTSPKRVRKTISPDHFITLTDGPTSDSTKGIDHCSVKWEGVFKDITLRVLKQRWTDHDAVVVSVLSDKTG